MRSLIPAIHIAALPSIVRATCKGARRATLLLFSIAVLLTGGAAAVHGQSSLDGFNPDTDQPVRVFAVQPDGKILIGGLFTRVRNVPRRYIARLHPDGTLDMDFDPNANGFVTSIAVQSDNRILVGGYFFGTNSIGRNSVETRDRIARLMPNGTLDLQFKANANDPVFSIVVQPSGQILVGGGFTSIGGQTRGYIARLNSNGIPDPDFRPNANNVVVSIAVQADGRILAGGVFTSIGGRARNRMARLIPSDGMADGFNPNVSNSGSLASQVNCIAVQADGKILVGGLFLTVRGQARQFIARLEAYDGRPDSFNPSASSVVQSIVVQPDGKILVCGLFTSIGGAARNYIARFDATSNGMADSFNPKPDREVNAIAVQADGRILAGGRFTMLEPTNGLAPPVARSNIARLEPDGRLDQTLADLFITGFVNTTAVQPDGKILIGGSFSNVLNMPRKNIARLQTDGTLDLEFDPKANRAVQSIVVQPDGKILVGGFFYGMNSIGGNTGMTRNRIARLNSNGTLEMDMGIPIFDPNAEPGGVFTIVVQRDAKILLGGTFTSLKPTGLMSPVIRRRIARLNPDGSLDLNPTTFDPNANDGVYSIALQADRQILVGGLFNGPTSIGGNSQTRDYIARLNPSGALDMTTPFFDPDPNAYVSCLAVQADGKILVSGGFISIGGSASRIVMARLNASGSMTGKADSFAPIPNSNVLSIAVQADGRVIAGGLFTTLNPIPSFTPTPRNRIARLNTSGSLNPFNPDAGGSVYSIAMQSDGKVLAGGNFPSMGGQLRGGFARLSNDTPALQNLAVTGNLIIWTRNGSSPELTRVTFEQSLDGGATYTFLGDGVRLLTTSTFALIGLNLPTGQNLWIRARGFYRSGMNNGSESITESVRNVLIPAPAVLNVSSRGGVGSPFFRTENLRPGGPPGGTDDNVGIAGFIITGTAPKHVLLRAIGPSLSDFGVPGALANPVIELHGPGAFTTITNDNWRDTQEAEILATGIPPANDLESAVEATLDPGTYTAVVRGTNNSSGIALLEVYDLEPGGLAKLANISTRAFVGTGDNIVIAGFTLGNSDGNDRIVVRGIGPSLTAFGVSDALANPTLELRDSNGALLVANNDWQDDPAQAAELTAAGLAPTDNLESAIAATLPPGPYTALFAGLNNGTGIGLVEVYDRGAP